MANNISSNIARSGSAARGLIYSAKQHWAKWAWRLNLISPQISVHEISSHSYLFFPENRVIDEGLMIKRCLLKCKAIWKERTHFTVVTPNLWKKNHWSGPAASQVFVWCVYQVTCNSFCLFSHKRILAAIFAEIPSFPRCVYFSNKWTRTRPLLARLRSCFRTLDHFIAHVWV